MDKQIEEIDTLTSVILEANHKKSVLDYHWIATEVYKAGYHKASDVARVIFAEIDGICRKYFNQCSKEPNSELMKMLQQGERFVINEMWHEFAELKKKYESEDTE